MEINKECGKRLRECFETSDFKTQQEFANATNFSAVYINNIMTGKKPMTVTAAKIFSEKLGVLENYLLCKTECKTEAERNGKIKNALYDMGNCFLALAGYNGLKIKKHIIETASHGKFTNTDSLGLLCFNNEENLLGKRTINGIECEVISIKYEIEIYGKTYIVESDKITELFDFITEYLQIQRSRLYHKLEKRNKFLDIDDLN